MKKIRKNIKEIFLLWKGTVDTVERFEELGRNERRDQIRGAMVLVTWVAWASEVSKVI